MGEKENILIVDDDESTRRSLSLILEKKGYKTGITNTGREALEKAQERSFNLALLDMRLPDMEGIDLLVSLKKMHPDMVVLIVTGYASLDTAVQALNKGASAYITKPLNVDEILAKVMEALEKQHLIIENKSLYEKAQLELSERKQAEEALKRNRDYLEKLNNSLLEVIFTVRIPGRVIKYVNESVETIFGYEPEECIGQTMEMLYPNREEYLKVGRKLHKVINNGKNVIEAECLLKRKTGETFPAEVTTTFFREGGKVTQVISAVRDITRRKQAEHNLDKRVRELKCLYNVADIAERSDIDLDEPYKEIVNVLPGGWQYPEVTCARITINGKRYQTDNYGETKWRQYADITADGAKIGSVEICYLQKRPETDEGPFLKEERLLIDAVAERVRRITEQMQAEEALRIAEQNFRNSLDSSPLGICIVSKEGKILYANQAVLDIYGYSSIEELNTVPAIQRHTPESYTEHQERKENRKLKKFVPNRCEVSIFRKDGEIRHLEVFQKEVLWSGKAQFQVVYHDITERKQAEKKVVEYEELNKLKTNLLSTVSHELRTPLATIKGYSTMLLDYDHRLQHKEKQEHLRSIDRATNRLTELIDRLLDMSRLEAGLLKLVREPTNISNLIQEAVAEAKLRAPGHKIVSYLQTRLPKLNIDARRVRQVLDNILDNATKYSEEGTKVVVSAQITERELLVRVVDQGVGIPVEERERVFDRMYRIEHRMNARIRGVGLGLAICKGLVEAHGGRIWVESKEGKGSTFSFALPL